MLDAVVQHEDEYIPFPLDQPLFLLFTRPSADYQYNRHISAMRTASRLSFCAFNCINELMSADQALTPLLMDATRCMKPVLNRFSMLNRIQAICHRRLSRNERLLQMRLLDREQEQSTPLGKSSVLIYLVV